MIQCDECDSNMVKMVDYGYMVSGEEGSESRFFEQYKCLLCGNIFKVVTDE